MKTKQEILKDLPNFYGTEAYHRWSPIFQNFVLTDGAKYIAEECGAYWLMDLVASHFHSYKENGFAVVHLDSHGNNKAGVVIEDGDGHALATQKVGYTDFPLDEITLYVVQSGDLWVLILTGEY